VGGDTVTEDHPRLSDADRHRAQLIGVAEAYSFSDPAFRHTLKTAVPLLRPEENVLAGVVCFRGYRPRLGLLLVTDQALLWVKQSFFRRHARAARVAFADLSRLRVFHSESDRIQVETFHAAVDGSVRRGPWFSVERSEEETLAAVCRVLRRLLGRRLENQLSEE
jgi:hypothetical protein